MFCSMYLNDYKLCTTISVYFILDISNFLKSEKFRKFISFVYAQKGEKYWRLRKKGVKPQKLVEIQ